MERIYFVLASPLKREDVLRLLCGDTREELLDHILWLDKLIERLGEGGLGDEILKSKWKKAAANERYRALQELTRRSS